jgi:olefin beta-lactone synthetase
VPVLIDPGIDKRALKQCLNEAAPAGLHRHPAGAAGARAAGWGAGSAHAGHRRPALVLGRRTAGRGRGAAAQAPGRSWPTPRPMRSPRSCSPPARPACPRAWSTGTATSSPRSICCGSAFGIQPGGVDLPTFPPFALFDPALGLTSVIPDMDPTRPAKADPRKLIAAIDEFGVGQMFGSPALLDTLSRWRAARRHPADPEARALGRRAGAAAVVGACRRCCPRTRRSGRPTAPPNACRWR